MMRLQKFLALSGVASRRRAEELIKEGRVKVNGVLITEMGSTVDEESDRVTLDGKNVKIESTKRYIILNKPKGYITTAKDNFDRKTVMELVSDIKERIYPVGRLDYDTEGLLLMTNDGDFANAIAHPKKSIEKVYLARVKGEFNEEKAEKLRAGVVIDGKKTAPAKVKILKAGENFTDVRIVIHEGRNRQVKKMFTSVGCFVTALKEPPSANLHSAILRRGRTGSLQRRKLRLSKHIKTRDNYV